MRVESGRLVRRVVSAGAASQGLDLSSPVDESSGRFPNLEDDVIPRIEDMAHGFRSQAAYDLAMSVQNRKATKVVAAQATDLDDCVELLAMLGLRPTETGIG